MRYYGFGNYYLSSLQQGLQAAHAIADLSVGLSQESPQYQTFEEWADCHKTIILLNGGNASQLTDLMVFLDTNDHELPFVTFYEDHESLNSTITHVGVIVPEKLYQLAEEIRNPKAKINEEAIELTEFERTFINTYLQLPLAR